MRPQSLTPLFAQVTSLPGIGPRLSKLIEKLAGPMVVDLLWHLPLAVIDRRNAPEVVHAKAGWAGLNLALLPPLVVALALLVWLKRRQRAGVVAVAVVGW